MAANLQLPANYLGGNNFLLNPEVPGERVVFRNRQIIFQDPALVELAELAENVTQVAEKCLSVFEKSADQSVY